MIWPLLTSISLSAILLNLLCALGMLYALNLPFTAKRDSHHWTFALVASS